MGPGVDKFAVVMGGRVGGDAVRAGLDSRFCVGAHFVPAEVQADPVQGFA